MFPNTYQNRSLKSPLPFWSWTTGNPRVLGIYCTSQILLQRSYGAFLQPIKLPHGNRPKARGENLAHKSLVPWVDSHPLIKVAHVFHRIDYAIVNGKCRLRKMMWMLGSINFLCKMWLWNLMKGIAHCIIPYVPRGWSLSSPSPLFLQLIKAWWCEERFPRGCPWPSSKGSVLFFIKSYT